MSCLVLRVLSCPISHPYIYETWALNPGIGEMVSVQPCGGRFLYVSERGYQRGFRWPEEAEGLKEHQAVEFVGKIRGKIWRCLAERCATKADLA